MTRTLRPLAVGTFALWAVSCPEKKPPPPEPPARCEVDLGATGLFSQVGSGAQARQIEAEDELIGGQFAQGQVGDFLLQNDKIRVVIQRPLRSISPIPYGGTIVDADRKRPAGERGRDQLGKLGLLYAFGRIANANRVEVLDDGSRGGSAVIAATGQDTVNDYMSVPNIIERLLGAGVTLVVDPNHPLPLRTTTYYVLSPGENRVRMLTAFCNEGRQNIVMPIGDLFEQGGDTDFFNPGSCANALGARGCLVDPSPWFGYQGEAVAYALLNYQFSDLSAPQRSNALLYISGVVGIIAGGEDLKGMLTWVDPDAARRPGAFGIAGGSQRSYLRDLFVARDLGEITSHVTAQEPGPRARLNVTASYPDGTPAAGARVAVISATNQSQVTLLVTEADGRAKVDLPSGGYQLLTGELGRALEPPVDIQVPSSGSVDASVRLGATRKLTVSVRDPLGAPLPAKVRVSCPGGPCATPSTSYERLYQAELLPSDVAALGLVPPWGTVELPLPPGQYELFVTRGPEYSAWPDTFPLRGEKVDLTTADQTRTATLARVVDTTGWMSADLHVHAIGSADSSVPNDRRALSFMGEGVDVLVSTDHDFVTDYGPVVRALGGEGQIATMIGTEVTPFDFGHQNVYPISLGTGPGGGAFDWAGGDGPTLRLDQLYAGLRERYPGVVIQMNHPRGKSGSLTLLKVDTATGATHADPERLRMEPSPEATSADTRLLGDFDAFEVANGFKASVPVLNDWMTFLSRGYVKTATAVSDTHHAYSTSGGYSRTYVELGVDTPAEFDPARFSAAIQARKAIGTNGPFVRLSAVAIDPAGQPVRSPVGLGGTLAVNAAAGEKLELTVDVQAPEWLTFDAIEIYTHAAGREALNGEENAEWPTSRIHQSRALDPTALPVEPVPGPGGFRRIHVVEKFVLSPRGDTWYVAIVRGSGATASLASLAFRGIDCDRGVCTPNTARAYAFTNAILIDGDASGAYDNYPLPLSQGLSVPRPRPAAVRRVPSLEEASRALREMLSHGEGR